MVQFNDERFELQGRQRENRTWVINEILPSGISKQVYSPAEFQDISLALFDPGQSGQWRSGHQSLYEVETGSIWTGEWNDLGEQSIKNHGQTVFGRTVRHHSSQGDWTGTWSNEGLLIDWELSIMGITLDANCENIPSMPSFGEIQVDNNFLVSKKKNFRPESSGDCMQVLIGSSDENWLERIGLFVTDLDLVPLFCDDAQLLITSLRDQTFDIHMVILDSTISTDLSTLIVNLRNAQLDQYIYIVVLDASDSAESEDHVLQYLQIGADKVLLN